MTLPRLLVSALCVSILILPACGVILPGHANSEDTVGESVHLRMLTFTDMASYKSRYCRFDTPQACAQDQPNGDCYQGYLSEALSLDSRCADVQKNDLKNIRKVRAVHSIADTKQWSSDTTREETLVASSAAVLVPLAVDLLISSVSKGLEKESRKYTATYGQSGSFDDFWRVVGKASVCETDQNSQSGYLVQNYAGFEIVRTTRKTTYAKPAFKMVFAFLPTSGGRLFRVVPLLQQVVTTKAKVLHRTWWTTPWAWTFKAGSTIDLDVDVSIDGMWIVDKKYTQQKLFKETLSTKQYDIVQSPTESFPGIDLGFFPGVPVSSFNQRQVGRGVFRLGVSVTERDHSNAVKILQKGVQQLSDNKDDWKKKLKEAVKPKEADEPKEG